MRPRRPFLFTATYWHGLSRTEFRRLPKADKIETMVEWFFENYEDPANMTPYESAEGGYQYIWGGPYDANDQIGGLFGGLVPDKWIEEAVDEVQRHGIYDWAPVLRSDDEDDSEPIPELSLDDIPDDPGAAFGTHDDYAARKRAAVALDNLQQALNTTRHIGIGHNRPPEDVDAEEAARVEEVKPLIQELREEFRKNQPSISVIKRLAYQLRDGMLSATKWTGKKLDIMVDEVSVRDGGGNSVVIGRVG
jgi:hypothetical protein